MAKPIPLSFKNNDIEIKMYDFLKKQSSPSAHIKGLLMKDDAFLSYIGEEDKSKNDDSNKSDETKNKTPNISSLSALKRIGK